MFALGVWPLCGTDNVNIVTAGLEVQDEMISEKGRMQLSRLGCEDQLGNAGILDGGEISIFYQCICTFIVITWTCKCQAFSESLFCCFSIIGKHGLYIEKNTKCWSYQLKELTYEYQE